MNEGALGHWELSRQKRTKLLFCRWNLKVARGTNGAFLYSAHVLYETFSPIYKNMVIRTDFIFFFGTTAHRGPGPPHSLSSRSHATTHHCQYNSSGWVISSSQRPLSDNTQQSQETNIHAPVGFEPTISAGERPQTYVLDRAATGIGTDCIYLMCR